MMQASRWHLALLTLLLSGCTRQATPPAVSRSAPAFDTIRFERTACFGECPVYAIEIGRNGQGKFIGKEFVAEKGAHDVHLSQEDVALLSSALQHVAFWSFKESYWSAENGCSTTYTDQPGLSISVVRAGMSKTVEYNYGCRGAAVPSEALDWLADTIDYLAHARQFVHGRPKQK